MTHSFSPTVERMISEKMASGRYQSEEELIIEALQSLDSEEDDLRAIQEGLESADRGDQGVSVKEAFDRLRARHGIREDS